jgi:hypothetical protein
MSNVDKTAGVRTPTGLLDDVDGRDTPGHDGKAVCHPCGGQVTRPPVRGIHEVEALRRHQMRRGARIGFAPNSLLARINSLRRQKGRFGRSL